MADVHHAIKTVARRTGLTAHVIRIWEKRYGAVAPERTTTNRRLYSEAQIERLTLLRNATQSGHSIGRVASLPTERLRELTAGSPTTAPAGQSVAGDLLADCIAAVKALDFHILEDALKRSETALGSQGMLQRVVGPLAQAIGELWRDGTITAAHEHFASAVIRVFLGHAAKPFAGEANAPVLVVATPAGQLHELGALLAGASAANLGWHVVYLGASLPAAEIAGAVKQNHARAVALSLVYPEDDPRLERELLRLRELLPAGVKLLVGGRATTAYAEAIGKAAALPLTDLSHFCTCLDQLRKPARNGAR